MPRVPRLSCTCPVHADMPYTARESAACADRARQASACYTAGSHVMGRTLPKMVFFLSSQSVLSNVMKNWAPLVWGSFWFAHATRPLRAQAATRRAYVATA